MTIIRTPEQALLILCTRPRPDAADRERTIHWVSRVLDWDAFVALTIRHKVFPLVYQAVRTLDPGQVPGRVIEILGLLYYKNTARNVYLSQALVRILDLFYSHGIQALPFKGPTLAVYVYQDFALRVFSDLDILVSPDDAIKARDLLVENGYAMDFDLPGDQNGDYLKYENFFHLSNRDGSVSIDLQWEISGRYALVPMELSDYAGGRVPRRFQGRTIQDMSDEKRLLYLCIHNSGHQWDHLERISCVAQLINRAGDMDGHFLIAEARKKRCLRMLLTGCHLAKRVFQVRLSPPVEDAIVKDKAIAPLGTAILTNLFRDRGRAGDHEISWRFSMLHIRSRDSLGDAVHYALRLLFRPTIKEWMVYSLPAPLSFLYPLLRPFRLVREYVSLRKHRKSADRALNHAELQGRNRVALWEKE